MAELPLDEAIPRLRSNEDRFDQFMNGGTTTSFTTTGGIAVPSIRKFLNDKNAEINTSATGILAQTTTAKDAALQAQADSEAARDQAGVHATSAADAESAAIDAKNAALQAQADSETARDTAGTHADDAGAAAIASIGAKDAALQAQADSEAARDQAGVHATNAADSEAASIAAKDLSVAARVASESARDTALAAFANFQDQYLGALPDEPTTDIDGSALDGGELYFNTTAGVMNIYTTDNGWVAAYVSATGIPLLANNGSDYDVAEFRTNLSVYSKAQIDAHTSDTNNPHGVTKAQVGLGNVDNTADANKPVSTAQADAIATKVALTSPTVQALQGGVSHNRTKTYVASTDGPITPNLADGNIQAVTMDANVNVNAAYFPSGYGCIWMEFKNTVAGAVPTFIGYSSSTNTGDPYNTALGAVNLCKMQATPNALTYAWENVA